MAKIIVTLVLGLVTTLFTAVMALPMLIPVYLAITKADPAYYILAVPGLLGFSYLNGYAMMKEVSKGE